MNESCREMCSALAIIVMMRARRRQTKCGWEKNELKNELILKGKHFQSIMDDDWRQKKGKMNWIEIFVFFLPLLRVVLLLLQMFNLGSLFFCWFGEIQSNRPNPQQPSDVMGRYCVVDEVYVHLFNFDISSSTLPNPFMQLNQPSWQSINVLVSYRLCNQFFTCMKTRNMMNAPQCIHSWSA